jgi:RNA polymerase sigma factor (sigma-70 family)
MSHNLILLALLAGPAGQGPCWAQLDACYRRRAVWLAYSLVRHVWPEITDEASDIAGEALAKAFSHLHQFDGGRPFWPWLAAIVRTTAIDRLRRYGRPLLGDHDVQVVDRTAPDRALLATEARKVARCRLLRALRALSRREQRLVLRFYRKGHTVVALAKRFGLAQQTVRGALSRSKKAILAALGLPRLTNRQMKELVSL